MFFGEQKVTYYMWQVILRTKETFHLSPEVDIDTYPSNHDSKSNIRTTLPEKTASQLHCSSF